MSRSTFLKHNGLSSLPLKDRWSVSNNKKRLMDLLIEKDKAKESFILKEKIKFLVFSLACEKCKDGFGWLKAKKEAKSIVSSLDKNIIDRQSRQIIKAFRKESKNEKNGLSKCRKSS